MRRLGFLYGVAAALTVLGAINWGFVGLFGLNLVRRFFGVSYRAERLVYAAVGVAGLGLAMAYMVPRALATLGVRRFYPREVLRRGIVGERLPTVTGTTLTGLKVTLPDDLEGRVAFIITGYSYESRFDVGDWARAFEERFGENPDAVMIEVPIISRLYRMIAPVIESGMRRGTPLEKHDQVVTVYTSRRSLREALGAPLTDDTWVYLLDREGTVVFQYGGPFNQEKFDEVVSLVELMLPGRRGRRRTVA